MARLPANTAHILVTSLLVVSQAVSQQSSSTGLSLEETLRHLQANRDSYAATVPDFFCDEHIVSGSSEAGKLLQSVTDSTFRLRRSQPDRPSSPLVESREIKLIDNVPIKRTDPSGPTLFSGAFSNAVSVVSVKLASCYDYRLVPNQKLYNEPATVIEFSSRPPDPDNISCSNREKHNGHVWIDPQTFELLRLEMEVPDHELFPGYLTKSQWNWTIDYAPVFFSDKTFWLPRKIVSKAVSEDEKSEWSFTATYSNYHKLTVSSHILPVP